MTLCLCGCGGEPAMGRYLRGHSRRGLLPYQRLTNPLVPIQRVLPLVEFLFTEHGSNCGVARAVRVTETMVRKWRSGRTRGVRRRCALGVVAAIKAEEDRLRKAAVEPDSLRRRHKRHLARGETDWSCDWCCAEVPA